MIIRNLRDYISRNMEDYKVLSVWVFLLHTYVKWTHPLLLGEPVFGEGQIFYEYADYFVTMQIAVLFVWSIRIAEITKREYNDGGQYDR